MWCGLFVCFCLSVRLSVCLLSWWQKGHLSMPTFPICAAWLFVWQAEDMRWVLNVLSCHIPARSYLATLHFKPPNNVILFLRPSCNPQVIPETWWLNYSVDDHFWKTCLWNIVGLLWSPRLVRQITHSNVFHHVIHSYFLTWATLILIPNYH